MFAFLYLKANSMEVCKEMFFPFFQKNADVSTLLRFRANYHEKMRGYPSFSLWIPITIAKIYVFPRVLSLTQNSLYLVGTVLKMHIVCSLNQCLACDIFVSVAVVVSRFAHLQTFTLKFSSSSIVDSPSLTILAP